VDEYHQHTIRAPAPVTFAVAKQEPLGPDWSMFITRARAVAADREARRKLRRYWAPASAGSS
jgi:hypothetical protein